jgi:hypothetical protein
MKKLLFIIALLLSFTAQSQYFDLLGIDTATGRPGYRYRNANLQVQSPLFMVNDHTIGSSGGIAFPTGYTGHGVNGTGYAQDYMIYKDTAYGLIGMNTTTPVGLIDAFPVFSGTVSPTNGSATLPGTNTKFLQTFKYGDSILINATTYAVVLSVQSNTSLTLTAAYTGSTASNQSYINVGAARGVFRVDVNGKIIQNGLLLSQNNLLFGSTSFGLGAMPLALPTGTTTNATHNSAFGVHALNASTRGYDNTAIGYNALDGNTTGGLNTAVGSWSLHSNNGIANTASGYFSLVFSTADGNTASGYQSMQNNSTGGYNAAYGYQSMYNSTSGQFNVAMGQSALYSNGSGNNNTAAGYLALFTNSGGTYNVAFGSDAMKNGGSGSNNVGIGGYALLSNTGNNNTALGHQTLYYHTSGNYNIAIGNNAGNTDNFGNANTTTTGSGYFGPYSTSSSPTAANELVISAGSATYWGTGNGDNTVTIGNQATTNVIAVGDLSNSVLTPLAFTVSTSTSGGSIAAGTYYYMVSAVDALGNTTNSSPVATRATTGSTSSNTITFPTLPYGATGWNVYRSTSPTFGNTTFIATGVTGSTYVDVAASATSGTPPSKTTAMLTGFHL